MHDVLLLADWIRQLTSGAIGAEARASTLPNRFSATFPGISASGATSTGIEADDSPWTLEVDEADHDDLWEWRVVRDEVDVGSGYATTEAKAKAAAEKFAKSEAAEVWDGIVEGLGGIPE